VELVTRRVALGDVVLAGEFVVALGRLAERVLVLLRVRVLEAGREELPVPRLDRAAQSPCSP
jgi:hypothetical protein